MPESSLRSGQWLIKYVNIHISVRRIRIAPEIMVQLPQNEKINLSEYAVCCNVINRWPRYMQTISPRENLAIISRLLSTEKSTKICSSSQLSYNIPSSTGQNNLGDVSCNLHSTE